MCDNPLGGLFPNTKERVLTTDRFEKVSIARRAILNNFKR